MLDIKFISCRYDNWVAMNSVSCSVDFNSRNIQSLGNNFDKGAVFY